MRDGHYALSEKAKATYDRIFRPELVMDDEQLERLMNVSIALDPHLTKAIVPGLRTYHYDENGEPVLDGPTDGVGWPD